MSEKMTINQKMNATKYCNDDESLPVLKKEPDSLSLSLDLDSLFGHVEIPIFIEHVWGDLVLSLDTKTTLNAKQLKSTHPIKIGDRFVKISSLPSIKLGVFETQFGTLDIHLVFRDSKLQADDLKLRVFRVLSEFVETNDEVLKSCFFLKPTVKDNTLKISGKLLNPSLNRLLVQIKNDLDSEDPIIFVETFGNKSSTITTMDDFDGIINKVRQTFVGKRALKNIFIDICISSSLGNTLVTVPNKSFFDQLSLTPNYQLFFSDTFSNLHLKTMKKNGTPNKTGKKLKAVKINFYSTIKYKIAFDKTRSYALPLTSSLLLSDLFGLKLTSSPLSIEETVKNFLNIDSLTTSRGVCPYRTEIRCAFKDRKKALRKLKKYTIPENFHAYNSDQLFDLILKNQKSKGSYI